MRINICLFSQTTVPSYKNPSVASPNAAAFSKYGEIPVSLKTGVTSIGIPITSVSEGPLSTSVSLSYHSSGVKVNELSTWVGLNWTANAGGAITRSVKGIADEGRHQLQNRYTPKGWYGSGVSNQVSSSVTNVFISAFTNCFTAQPTSPSTTLPYDKAIDGRTDVEPDIFYFNFGGYSGKFYLNPDSTQEIKAFTSPTQDLKIQPIHINNSFDYWIVTTPDGTRYYFGQPNIDETLDKAIDITVTRSVSETYDSFDPTTSAWYLTKIESADKLHTIVLNYGLKDVYRYKDLKNETLIVLYGNSCPQGEPGDENPYSHDYNLTQSVTDVSAARLEQVITTNERINFISNTNREDVIIENTSPLISSVAPQLKARALDEIQLADANGNCLKKFKLNYSYFKSAVISTGYQITGSYDDTKRLRLDNVQELNCTGTEPITHTFDYYGNTNPDSEGTSTNLPRRKTFAIDHWGYNNGKISNASLVPTTTLVNSYGNPVTCQYSDRDAYFPATQAATLSKITYPTGGTSEFVYEPNTYNIDKIVRTEERKFYLVSPTMTTGVSPTQSYTTPQSMTGMKYRVKFIPIPNSTQIGSGKVYKNGAVWIDVANQIDEALSLQPNTTYTFQVGTTNGTTIFEIYKETLPLVNVNEIVGGIRIKQVITKSDASSTSIIKEYGYGREGEEQKSSGVYFGLPDYLLNASSWNIRSWTACIQVDVTSTACASTQILYYLSGSALPKLNLDGSNIGYKRVTVKETNNGYSENMFNYTIPFFNKTYPQVSHYNQDPLNGTLTRERIFDNNNNIKQETNYTYASSLIKTLLGQAVTKHFQPCTGGVNTYMKNDYTVLIFRVHLLSKESKSDNVTSTTQYSYNTLFNHHNPIETITFNSDGKTIKSKVYFAQDLPSNHPNYAQKQVFIDKYMIGIPLQVESTLGDDTKKTGGLVQFDNFNTSVNNQQWYPSNYYSFDKNNALKLQFTINEYFPAGDLNNQGLVKKATKAGFTSAPEFYFWAKKLLTQKQMGLTGAVTTLTSSYTYLPNTSLPIMITDENGLRTKFTYDGFQRLSKTENRFDGTLASPIDVQATTLYKYHYKGQPTDVPADVDYNFVQTYSTFKGITTPLSTKQYLDGLGRPIEVVKEGYTPNGGHQKSYISYDALGRQDKTYLPFESFTLGVQVPTSYLSSYALTEFEKSPLSRPIKQTNVDNTVVTSSYGTNTTSEVRLCIFTNTTTGVTVSSSSYYAANTLYKTIVTDENGKITYVFKDKLGRVILTRKFLGSQTSGTKVDTYNVYDDYGQLVAVLPPGSMDEYAGTVTEHLIFWYKFDNQNRLIEKKIPGTTGTYKFYYDNRDLVTLTQDPNMSDANYRAFANQHLATQYDALGRVERTGFVATADPVTFAATAFTIPDGSNKLTEIIYYPNKSWVKHRGVKFLETHGPTNTNFIWSYEQRDNANSYTGNPGWIGKQHLITGPLVNRPISEPTDTWGVDWSSSAYNGMQQAEVTYRYLYGYSWIGNKVITRSNFAYDNGRRLTDVKFNYTTDGSFPAEATNSMSNLVYNYKDQLTERNIGYNGSTALQSVDYSYNLRGWLTAINDVTIYGQTIPIMTPPMSGGGYIQGMAVMPFAKQAITEGLKSGSMVLSPVADNDNNNGDLFKQAITYGSVDTRTGGTPQYNGNISTTTWQVKGRAKQAYAFTYDDLDRLLNAKYMDVTDSGSGSSQTSNYSTDNKFEEKQTYDLRGNILTLERNGLNTGTWTNGKEGFTAATYGKIDNLIFAYYEGNRLIRVQENSLPDRGYKTDKAPTNTEWQYGYDPNGNLKFDFNKGITGIWYNHLNLPSFVYFSDGRQITFNYTADGELLRKTTYNPINNTSYWMEYVNGTEFKNWSLNRLPHPEGAVIRNDAGNYEYEYLLKDHLGSNRVVFRDKDNDRIIDTSDIKQINHYYPFGMDMEGNWNGSFMGSGTTGNAKKFNGIEYTNDYGLNVYSAFYRTLDPAIGRWWHIDPKPNFSESSYSAMGNNPMRMTDPLGDTTWVYSSKNGKYIDRVDGDASNQIHFMSANAYYKINNKSENAVRKASNYFIGKNTRAALAALNAPTKRDGQEQIFLMGYSKANKELSIFNVTKNKTINNAGSGGLPGMSGGFDNGGIQNFIKKNANYTFIGWGHSHPGDKNEIRHSLSPSSPDFYEDGSISKTWDMDSQGMVNPFSGYTGGNPSIIPTPHGFSIYSTIRDELINDYSLQKMSINPPVNITRDSYDFNGNTIFKR